MKCPHCQKEIKAVAPEGFDAWWKAYPRKIVKVYAKRAYGKALLKITEAELLRLTQAYAERMKDKDVEFIPYPSTWLNQERWADETPTDTNKLTTNTPACDMKIPPSWIKYADPIIRQIGYSTFLAYLGDTTIEHTTEAGEIPYRIVTRSDYKRDWIAKNLGPLLLKLFGSFQIVVR